MGAQTGSNKESLETKKNPHDRLKTRKNFFHPCSTHSHSRRLLQHGLFNNTHDNNVCQRGEGFLLHFDGYQRLMTDVYRYSYIFFSQDRAGNSKQGFYLSDGCLENAKPSCNCRCHWSEKINLITQEILMLGPFWFETVTMQSLLVAICETFCCGKLESTWLQFKVWVLAGHRCGCM